jgi:hypothetical protein
MAMPRKKPPADIQARIRRASEKAKRQKLQHQAEEVAPANPIDPRQLRLPWGES